MTTVVTESSYISRACSAESPASIISAGEDVGPDDGDPDGQDDQPDGGAGDGGQGDPAGDARGRSRPARRPIADAADRLDVARRIRVVVELVAQAPDVDVDRPIEDLGRLVAVDRVEQLVARQDPAVGAEDRLDSSRNSTRVRSMIVPSSRRTSWRDGSMVRSAWRRIGASAVSGLPWSARRPRGAVRRRIDLTRSTSSAGENGLGR